MYGSSAEASSSGASVVSNPTAGRRVPSRSDGGDQRVVAVQGLAPVSTKRRKHICNERQRRVQMNTLLESLQALLPDPTPRKDRCSLLIDIINYLQSLEDKIEELATCKGEIMSSITESKTISKPTSVDTLTMPLLQVNLKNFHVQVSKVHKCVDGLEEIILTFISPRIKGLFSHILMLFDINRIKIINATITSTPNEQLLRYIHAEVPKDLNLQSEDLKALFSSSSEFTLSEEKHKP